MKKIVLYLLCCVLSESVAQDSGFTQSYEMEVVGASFHNLMLQGDTVVLAGTAKVDSLDQWGLLFAQFDTLGNLLNHRVYADTSGDHYVFERNYGIIASSDGGYVMTGNLFYKNWGFMAKLDRNGELEFLREYPEVDIRNYAFKNVIELSDGYLIAGTKQVSNYTRKVFLLKTDLAGHQLWEKKYGELNEDLALVSASVEDENTFYINASKSSYPFQSQFIEGEDWMQGELIAVDSLGEEKWIWKNEVNKEAFYNDSQPTADGGLLYGTGEFVIQNPWTWAYDLKVVKRDSAFNEEWSRSMTTNLAMGNFLHDLKIDADGNIIALGTWQGEGANFQATCLYKLSPNGDSIWTRCDTMYDPSYIYDYGEIGGIVILPSGSIIGAGKVNRYDPQPTRSLGWLYKVTRDGCLEDLCASPVVSTRIPNIPKVELYPNPVQDNLQIIFPEEFDLYLYDALGREHRRVLGQRDQSSMYLGNLKSGIYFLELRTGFTKQVRKIIVE
ncbi:MAG: T9SS type A sorting domain-containing protein [Saprospiraceae bacterium]